MPRSKGEIETEELSPIRGGEAAVMLNAMWNATCAPGPEKVSSGKPGEIPIRLEDKLIVLYKCSSPGFNDRTLLMKC